MLRPTHRRELRERIERAEASFGRSEACLAASELLAAVEAIREWQVDIKRTLEAAATSDHHVRPLENRLAVLVDLHDRFLRVHFAVAGSLPPGTGCGGPATFVVDPAVMPQAGNLPGFADGQARPLAAVLDARGNQADFVANELWLTTGDPAQLDSLVARRDGQVLSRVDDGVRMHYLIRIAPAEADADELERDVASLVPGVSQAHLVSNELGFRLLAVAAAEAAAGLTVGVNFVGAGATFETRQTTEAPSGPDGFTDLPFQPYSPDAYEWTHIKSGSIQDVGVTEAWTLMAGRDA